jgi:membrane associated rhomboid family serine protease
VLPIKDNVPTRTFPYVTVALIAVNAAVWIWEITGTSVDTDVFHYGYYPCSLEGPCVEPATLFHHVAWYEGIFTSMFMHGSWLHIGGNMLFLWIFGNNVEDALGHAVFLVWYLAAGLAATLAQTVVTLVFAGAAGASIPNVGASGAIAGVLGAYIVLLPNASVLTAFILIFLVFLREIPAMWFIGIWFLFQLWEGSFGIIQPQSGGGVAFFAHIGGFVFGFLTIRVFARHRPLRPRW